MDIWRPEEDSIHQRNEQKMITSRECLQMKRDLEAKLSDFEISPLTLSLMITFLLFGIGFWIWLISWSCLFEKPMGNTQNNKEKTPRLSGGKSSRSHTTEGRFSDGESASHLSGISEPPGLLRRYPPIISSDYIPNLDHISEISLPVAKSNPDSIRRLETSSPGPATSTTPRLKTLLHLEAGPRPAYGSLKRKSLDPIKKYNIQWTKLLRRDRRDDSDSA